MQVQEIVVVKVVEFRGEAVTAYRDRSRTSRRWRPEELIRSRRPCCCMPPLSARRDATNVGRSAEDLWIDAL